MAGGRLAHVAAQHTADICYLRVCRVRDESARAEGAHKGSLVSVGFVGAARGQVLTVQMGSGRRVAVLHAMCREQTSDGTWISDSDRAARGPSDAKPRVLNR